MSISGRQDPMIYHGYVEVRELDYEKHRHLYSTSLHTRPIAIDTNVSGIQLYITFHPSQSFWIWFNADMIDKEWTYECNTHCRRQPQSRE